MALMDNYLVKTASLHSFLNLLLNAQAPDKFTGKFLEQLGFSTTNDKLLIGVLKGLGFLDGSGVPTQRYFRFLDQSESKIVLAEAIKEAYADLFAINTKANEMSSNEVKNKLKTITQGTKSESVLDNMVRTFKSLCDYADFRTTSNTKAVIVTPENKDNKQEDDFDKETPTKTTHELVSKKITTEMHYNIQIHLPETRDISVYDAIFKSLKEHLL
ncbi:MAG: DUF5343 domain-containing protein [Chitinophaga sp.]|uniref:DUF5343 domain-containing protein n=1 Tax=Chitinophaga sp. TaxID=1869181 RepID=UPI001B1CAC4C|nr:DUF5343 domain-containing protein [Chitinophaga sp.]MBO9728406.1 DUF5343 domain-containing protein [Chitinophaga sp.]